ncbi:uncharacterized protein N7511_004344 [Penicillium nucicola]|uniref:uncharacterized protein n=1 Tax=Penicillium nucicola TaxID=1850975 RepID=UPI0025450A3A|nr:uncharacterized protein N7511_004344 [Penicillium nucicola]KAJ5766728.1 hypothetical protein N7511_004344 [Penicillium nucicola]
MSLEIPSNAKKEHVVVAEQAILALVRRTRLSQPSRRTLKELYEASFNSLHARMCRDLLYKWVAIMRNAKGSLNVERPSWWPESVRYTSASKLRGPEIKAVLFHLFYGEDSYVPLRAFYTACRDINISKTDQKTLSWTFYIRNVCLHENTAFPKQAH